MTGEQRHSVTRWAEKKRVDGVKTESFHWSCRFCKESGEAASKNARDGQVRAHKGEK